MYLKKKKLETGQGRFAVLRWILNRHEEEEDGFRLSLFLYFIQLVELITSLCDNQRSNKYSTAVAS